MQGLHELCYILLLIFIDILYLNVYCTAYKGPYKKVICQILYRLLFMALIWYAIILSSLELL